MTHASRRAVAVVLVVVALAACQPRDVSKVRNGTDGKITVQKEGADGNRRPAVSELGPGQGNVVVVGVPSQKDAPGLCSTVRALIALDSTGAEIDRLDGPFCKHFIWVVDGR